MRNSHMNKRGQATIFVVIGIIIIVLIALILVGRKTFFLPTTPDSLSNIRDDIATHIQECITDNSISEDVVVRLGMQGGYLSPGVDTFRLFNDTQVSYLCYNMDKTELCRNRLLLLGTMEQQLNDAMKPKLQSCIGDLKSFARLKPITIETPKQMDIQTTILPDTILVVVNYPVVIKAKNNNNQVQQQTFQENLDYPLGELYSVSQTILDQETTLGDFDPLLYLLAKKGDYIVYKQRPYPDKLYTIKRSDDPYVFQFFVQGQPGTS